jgi:hypothetical protein
MRLPSLSIAAKLYTIFALLATATIALAGVGVVFMWRAVTRPPGVITQVIETVAGGAGGVAIP